MRGHAESLPALAVTEIADEAVIEVADASAGMAERIATDGVMKTVVDPLKVVGRVIADKDAAPVTESSHRSKSVNTFTGSKAALVT